MKKDERYRGTCTRLLNNKHFYDIETAPIEELTAIVDFIRLLKVYRHDGYNNITLSEINDLFTIEE